MKMATVRKRPAKDRPHNLGHTAHAGGRGRRPERLAPPRGFSGYQALMRAYVGAGLREDMERFEHSDLARLLDNLRARGVPEETLSQAA